MTSKTHFYPRSPCGERRNRRPLRNGHHPHFYPRSPCGERRWLRCWQLAARDISIHALLAESDFRQNFECFKWIEFLSTLSLRRATMIHPRLCNAKLNFYPRSPCGERRWLRCWQLAARDISIHALLAESDCVRDIINDVVDNFYPRSPCGERRHQQGCHQG